MRKLSHLKKYAGIVFTGAVLLGSVELADSQGLISREARPRWGSVYENFGTYDIRKYPETLMDKLVPSASQKSDAQWVNPAWHGPADPVSFDQFGNFLLPGGDIFNMNWDMSSVGAKSTYSDDASTIFNNLMVSSDEFSNWQTQFMVGTALRAYFTPSTLKVTRFNGVRWDASSRKNSFTFLASVGNNPGFSQTLPASTDFRNLFGLYWESVLGDILKIGGTFVANQRGTEAYSQRDIETGLSGLKERDIGRYVYVVISDDSPEDQTSGAVVYAVKPKYDGKSVDVPQRAFAIPNVLNITKYTTSDNFTDQVLFMKGSSAYIPNSLESLEYSKGSWFLSLMNKSPETTYNQFFNKHGSTGVLGYLNIPDPDNTTDPSGGRYFAANSKTGYYEAKGTDIVIYEFYVPPGVRNVQFDVNVANDYCIDIIAAMPSRQQTALAGWDDAPGEKSGKWTSSMWSPIYDAKNAKKASGNVKDYSNAGWVSVSYDRLTGMNAYGINLDFNWRGLTVKGEINEYNAFFSYPIHEYLKGEKQNKETSRAWFVNVEKTFKSWSVGGEFFDYPNEYMRYWAPIDDNDDNNQYSGGSEYPGINVDWDRTSDSRYVDFTWQGEPYVEYYFDKIEFGDDFNHNSIIDDRENDNQADLPYDRDSKGQHYFLKVNPLKYTRFTIGHYNIEQEVFDGRNLTDYFKMEHMQRFGKYLEIGLFNRSERVHDNYKSDEVYSQFGDPSSVKFNNMAYKNAWFTTSMIKTDFSPMNNFHLINNFKYDVVNRVGDYTVDGSADQQRIKVPADIVTSSSVHKADYSFTLADFKVIPDIFLFGNRIMREKRIKEFRFQPQYKYESIFYTANYVNRDSYYRSMGGHYYRHYPVIRFDYRVAPKTLLRCAFQGVPGLLDKIRDTGDKLQDKDRRRFFVGFETTTLYQGFNLLVTSGVRRTKESWIRSYGRTETGFTDYFIELRCEASK